MPPETTGMVAAGGLVPPEAVAGAGLVPPETTGMVAGGDPVLAARGVRVRFGGVTALDGVDLSVRAGMVTGLIGPNGAGKTTLFNVLSGVLRPAAGTVHLGGRDVTRWPPHRRGRAGVARTFQRLELFGSMTVLDNLAAAWEAAHPGGVLGRGRAVRRQRVEAVLEALELGPVAGRLAGTLPTGSGRMVELARALCTDPQVLLLDEPGSGLDAGETDRLAHVLRQLVGEEQRASGERAVARPGGGPGGSLGGGPGGGLGGGPGGGLAVLLVEHDMRLVMDVCRQVTVLDFGKVIACGSPDEVRRDPSVRAAYLGGESDVA